jgi:hypothetical protein
MHAAAAHDTNMHVATRIRDRRLARFATISLQNSLWQLGPEPTRIEPRIIIERAIMGNLKAEVSSSKRK